jgi:NADPH:quinone reductase-like Zn-dependent oxidoreductase
MKAVICTKYGGPEVLRLKEVKKPIPRKKEILIKIHVTTVHVGDTRIRGFNVPPSGWIPFRLFLGIIKPRQPILGMDLAGTVEAVGMNVRRFKAGDEVFGSTAFKFGAYAEYRCLPESGMLVHKPENVSFEEAAPLLNGGLTALCILKKADIQKDQKVLIYGASGSVGTYAVQIARYLGAEVTGVCGSSHLELVKSLGADRVLDYTAQDFSLESEHYDLVFDAVGKLSAPRAKSSLKRSGIYLNVLKSSAPGVKDAENHLFLKDLLESGTLKTVIDRRYSLEQIVEAHRYVDQGHKLGNVIITVGK